MKENEQTEMINSKIDKLKFVREAKRHETMILETEVKALKKKSNALKKQSLTSVEEWV